MRSKLNLILVPIVVLGAILVACQTTKTTGTDGTVTEVTAFDTEAFNGMVSAIQNLTVSGAQIYSQIATLQAEIDSATPDTDISWQQTLLQGLQILYQSIQSDRAALEGQLQKAMQQKAKADVVK